MNMALDSSGLVKPLLFAGFILRIGSGKTTGNACCALIVILSPLGEGSSFGQQEILRFAQNDTASFGEETLKTRQ
jgi:hypothetical protein